MIALVITGIAAVVVAVTATRRRDPERRDLDSIATFTRSRNALRRGIRP